MPNSDAHIVRSYSDELQNISALVAKMGGLAETILTDAMTALVKRDADLSTQAIQADKRVDSLDAEIEYQVVRMLALRQPMAVDLRSIISALKIAQSLERIADHAKNGAKRALVINQSPPMDATHGIVRLSDVARDMLRSVLDAYVNSDAEGAIKVRDRDEDLDVLYDGYFRECLTYMMEDNRNITAATHLLFIAKNIERIGDHCTNIAENVYYMQTGERLSTARPKGEDAMGLKAE